MDHFWQSDFYTISGEHRDVLTNIGEVWSSRGYDQLEPDDYARLEPFLEPFDAVYTEEEVAMLSRLGRNGVQDEFAIIHPPQPQNNQPHHRAEWFLPENDMKQTYLNQVAQLVFPDFVADEALLMLTHALATLRQLSLSFGEESIHAVFDDEDEEAEEFDEEEQENKEEYDEEEEFDEEEQDDATSAASN